MQRMATRSVTRILLVVTGLTAVSLPGCTKYRHKARSTDAIRFLTDIKLKQETYFQKHGKYVDTTKKSGCSFDEADFHPPAIASGGAEWGIECPRDKDRYPGWCALGATPWPQSVNYQFVTVGWQPGEDCTPPTEYISDPTRRWWYAEARGDLDGDGVYSTFSYSSEHKEVEFYNVGE